MWYEGRADIVRPYSGGPHRTGDTARRVVAPHRTGDGGEPPPGYAGSPLHKGAKGLGVLQLSSPVQRPPWGDWIQSEFGR